MAAKKDETPAVKDAAKLASKEFPAVVEPAKLEAEPVANAAAPVAAGADNEKIDRLAAAVEAMLALLGKLVIGLVNPEKKGKDEASDTPGKPYEQDKTKQNSPGGDKAAELMASANDSIRLDKMEAKLAAAEREKKIEARLNAAIGELSAWNLSAATKERMAKVAASDEDGALLKLFVEDQKEKPKDPPTSLGAYEGAAMKQDGEEVLAYAAKGPEVLAAARRWSNVYDDAVKRGHTNATRKAFLAVNIATELGQPV